jgi:hypothetical protein
VRFNYLGVKKLDFPPCLNHSVGLPLAISGCLITISCTLESSNYSI